MKCSASGINAPGQLIVALIGYITREITELLRKHGGKTGDELGAGCE
jgi:hypothetical protein